MTAQSTGLRALKKRQTRENISSQATRLFLERGFDNVTIAEAAAAAQVSKMTVTNYFLGRRIWRWTCTTSSCGSWPPSSGSASSASRRWRRCAAPTSLRWPRTTRSSGSPVPRSPG
ncbi:TetR/AcrR family transcriptional regulator [Micromonospora sp. BRA006-A]|nr:TetR/AcrR family transcriptional regulator [Micromonospora sp. BRA006-A]